MMQYRQKGRKRADSSILLETQRLPSRTQQIMTPSRHSKSRPKFASTDIDGNHIHNEILLLLPPNERKRLFSKLEFVRFNTHHVLHEARRSIGSVYFVNSGLASVLSVLTDGKSVEVGLIGKEGFVGLALLAGFRKSFTRVITQADTTAFRLDADVLRGLLPTSPILNRELQRLLQIATVEISQLAACNRLHQVNQRLARRLLMSQDRISSESLPVTHESLALMLGTRRSSVSLAAGVLQNAGIIDYTRGNVVILSRPALERAACECYELIRRHIKEENDSGS
jgi:CRP-like cAMP-binding protein